MTVDYLHQPQAAALRGVTVRRLRQMDAEDDPPPKTAEGKYPCEDFGKWLKRQHIAGLGVTDDGRAYDYESERARLTHHQANKTALEESVLSGELLPCDSVEKVWSGMISAFRAKMLSIPVKAAQLVIASADLAEAELILRDLIHEALDELKDYDPSQYHRETGAESRGDHRAAADADSQRVGGRKPKAKQRSKRRAGPVEH